MNNLKGGTVLRLAQLRARAAKYNTVWRAVRYAKCGYVEAHGPYYVPGKDYATVPTSTLEGFRDVGDVSDVLGSRRFYGGYYADVYGMEVYTGHVWQLPARDGKPQYIAGYIEQEGGYAVIEARGRNLELYDDKNDAAHAADELARIMAEQNRDYSELDQAHNDAMEEKDDAKTAVLNLTRAIKAQKAAGPLAVELCGLLTDKLDQARDNWKDKLNAWIDAARALSRA